MPHKHSVEALASHRELAGRLGLLQPLQAGHRHGLVRADIADRVKHIAASLDTHRCRSDLDGHPSYFARVASMTAHANGYISKEELLQALEKNRCSNHAKHNWSPPQLGPLWGPLTPPPGGTTCPSSRSPPSSASSPYVCPSCTLRSPPPNGSPTAPSSCLVEMPIAPNEVATSDFDSSCGLEELPVARNGVSTGDFASSCGSSCEERHLEDTEATPHMPPHLARDVGRPHAHVAWGVGLPPEADHRQTLPCRQPFMGMARPPPSDPPGGLSRRASPMLHEM